VAAIQIRDDVDCRVWIYEEKEYTQPPKAMIVRHFKRSLWWWYRKTRGTKLHHT